MTTQHPDSSARHRGADLGLPVFLILVTCLTLATDRLEAQGLGNDLLLLSNGSTVLSSDLPLVDLQPDRTLDAFVTGMTFTSGRLLALEVTYDGTQAEAQVVEVDAAGALTLLFPLPLETGEDPVDMIFGPDGQLWVLSEWLTQWNPPEVAYRLVAYSLDTGEPTATVPLEGTPWVLAPSTLGLWLLDHELGLSHVDLLGTQGLRVGTLDFDGIGLPIDADSDSSGAIWFATEPGFVDPPLFSLWRFDPASGLLELVESTLPIAPVSVAIEQVGSDPGGDGPGSKQAGPGPRPPQPRGSQGR